jgi:hypothetical protein
LYAEYWYSPTFCLHLKLLKKVNKQYRKIVRYISSKESSSSISFKSILCSITDKFKFLFSSTSLFYVFGLFIWLLFVFAKPKSASHLLFIPFGSLFKISESLNNLLIFTYYSVFFFDLLCGIAVLFLLLQQGLILCILVVDLINGIFFLIDRLLTLVI